MVDATRTTKVYMADGGDRQVIASDGSIDVEAGGKQTADGAQAAAIADLTAITGGQSPTEGEHNDALEAINGILAALRGVGIVATS